MCGYYEKGVREPLKKFPFPTVRECQGQGVKRKSDSFTLTWPLPSRERKFEIGVNQRFLNI
jgi:hypothetical protein